MDCHALVQVALRNRLRGPDDVPERYRDPLRDDEGEENHERCQQNSRAGQHPFHVADGAVYIRLVNAHADDPAEAVVIDLGNSGYLLVAGRKFISKAARLAHDCVMQIRQPVIFHDPCAVKVAPARWILL